MVSSFMTSLAGGRTAALTHGQETAISGGLTGNPALGNFFSNPATPDANPNAPRAYLNWIFFDEQFNFVQQVSGFKRVSQAGDGAAPIVTDEIKAIRNGYVYVYLSNESSEPVYYDNFSVSHERGRLIGEDHYYAYGLKIAAISSKSVSSSLNKNVPKYGYQGAFSEETLEFELNYNEFFLRTYDPQIGRWTTPDPYDQFASPYSAMGMDPANNTDPSGGSVPGLEDPVYKLLENVTLAVKSASTAATISSKFTEIANSLSTLSIAGNALLNSIIVPGNPTAHTTPANQSVMLPGNATNIKHFDGNQSPGNWRWSNPDGKKPTADQLNAILPKGTLESFTIGDEVYSPVVVQGSNDSWIFKGYQNQKGSSYNESNYVKKSDFDSGHKSALASSLPIALTLTTSDGVLPVGDAVAATILLAAAVWDLTQRTYVTYTLSNPVTNQIYIGRTSGYGDPETIMMRRYYSHHMRAFGFASPELDRWAMSFPKGYFIIRGREQQLLDYHGGVGHKNVGNTIRAVSRFNEVGRLYHNASSAAFGEIHPFTGYDMPIIRF